MKFSEWVKKWIIDFALVNGLKTLIISFFVFITYNFASFQNNTGALIFAGFSVLFILFFYGNNFEFIEFFGTKFKIKQIKKSIDELKSVTKVLTRICLGIAQASGRWGGIHDDDLKMMYTTTNKLFDLLEFEENEKNEVFKEWQKWTKFDNAKEIVNYLDLNDKELTGIQRKNNTLYIELRTIIGGLEDDWDIIKQLDSFESKELIDKICTFDDKFKELYEKYLGKY